ncbi:obscurin-like isoform X2 [Trichomycterus rosablanca]|uniref:obscurin-like isoform X2 n=1 Tax=Trichomycterus rosablanca TaxID=2290929 RepID=UPI002F35156F
MEISPLSLMFLLILLVQVGKSEVKPKPTVTGVPQSFIYTGDVVTLNCELQEQQSTEWTFIWLIHQFPLPLVTTNTNPLSVSTTDAGKTEYLCIGRRKNYDSEFSDTVTITVKERPKAVLNLLPDGRIFSGEHVTVTCEIQDTNKNWMYNWFKDNQKLFPANENREYSFTATEQDSGSSYTCSGQRKIHSQNSEISNTVTLTVSAKPKPTVIGVPQSFIYTGDVVTLYCELQEQQSAGWTFNWYKITGKNPTPVTPNTNPLSVKTTNAGVTEYQCRAHRRNYDSEFSDRVTITVKERPKAVLNLLPDGRIFSEEKVTLTCEIQDTSEDWKYNWFKYDHKLSSAGENREYSFTATEQDSGRYTCSGQSKIHSQSSEISNTVTLTVSERPNAVLNLQPGGRIFSGEHVTLTCEIQDTNKDWKYYWFKDKLQLLPAGENRELSFTATEQYSGSSYTCSGESKIYSMNSEISNTVTLTVSELKPKPKLTSNLNGAALTGNSVTLYCELDPQSAGWKFYWFKQTQNHQTETTTHSYTISSVSVSDVGQYWCRPGRGNPVYYTHYSDALWVNVTESPKAVVTINPDNQVFSGETVTLRCDIQRGGDAEWTYSWNKTGGFNPVRTTQEFSIRSVIYSDGGKYTCRGERKSDSENSEISDTVILTVSDRPQPVLNVSVQNWLTEGDSVTLSCEVRGSTTGWIFSWYKVIQYSSSFIRRENLVLLSDSSRGAGGSYTLSPAVLNHTGVYVCGAERGEPAYHTQYSQPQPLWITGESGSVSLIISPSRTQHFYADSLSLSCKGQRDSTGWRVRRYRESKDVSDCSSDWKSASGSTCNISFLYSFYTGVYWCQSESGGSSNPVNITVHDGDVILESPVHPVTEGRSLTLRCLYIQTNVSDHQAHFHKDGLVLQKPTTDNMTIHSVSKSDEGFYHCKHPEKGESPKSWISVQVSSRSHSEDLLWVLRLMTVSLFVLPTIILVNIYYRTQAKPDETERWNREYEVIEAEASC